PEWRLDGAGIRCQRHSQRKRPAGKTFDCEPRYYGAQKGAGGIVAFGRELPSFGRGSAVRNLPGDIDGPISGSEFGPSKNAGVRNLARTVQSGSRDASFSQLGGL